MIFKVLRGENLPASDVNGKSDPFVKVLYDGRELGTSIRIKKNLNPIWDFTVAFPLVHASWMYLVVEVWDRDELSANDLLGALRVPFPEWREHLAIYQEKINTEKKKKIEKAVARQAALAAVASAKAAAAAIPARAVKAGTTNSRNEPGYKTLSTKDLGLKSRSNTIRRKQQQQNNLPRGTTIGADILGASSIDEEKNPNLITSSRSNPPSLLPKNSKKSNGNDGDNGGDSTNVGIGSDDNDPPLPLPPPPSLLFPEEEEEEVEEEKDFVFLSSPIYMWSSLVKGSMAKGRVLCSFQFDEKDLNILNNQPYGTNIQQIFLPQNPRFQQFYCHLPRTWHPEPNVRQEELFMLHAGTPKDCLFPWHEKFLHMIEEVTVTFHVNEANQGILSMMVLTNYRVWFVPYRRVKGLLHEDVHTISIGNISKAIVSHKKRKGLSSGSSSSSTNSGSGVGVGIGNSSSSSSSSTSNSSLNSSNGGGNTTHFVTSLIIENMDAGLYHVTLSPLSSRMRRGKNGINTSREAEAKRIKQLQNIVSEIEWLKIENSFCSTKNLHHEVVDDKTIETFMITASAAASASASTSASTSTSTSVSVSSAYLNSPSRSIASCSSSSTKGRGSPSKDHYLRHSSSSSNTTRRSLLSKHAVKDESSTSLGLERKSDSLVIDEEKDEKQQQQQQQQQLPPPQVPSTTLTRAATMGNLAAIASTADDLNVDTPSSLLLQSNSTHVVPTSGRPFHPSGAAIMKSRHSTIGMMHNINSTGTDAGCSTRTSFTSLRHRIRYDAEKEFRRQGALDHPHWRVTCLNENYELCSSYPSFLMVPSILKDEQIVEASRFRSKNRLPVLTWIHPRHGAPLCRSSQPNTGVLRCTNVFDKELIWAIRDAACAGVGTTSTKLNFSTKKKNNSVLNIVDARPEINAKTNAFTGKGHESVKQYDRDGIPCASITFMGIDNIHVVRNSFHLLSQALYQTEDGTFFHAIQKSKWLEHVCTILLGASEIVHHLERKEAVLVHCSDGWDRTAQLVSLAQIMLDPFFRTIEGFAILIEKDWCSFGHLFKKRCGHPISDQTSPIFLQFLDAVYQMTLQFPKHFQFNEMFLSFIAEAVYSSWFHTFQENSEKERKNRFSFSFYKTISVWDIIRASIDQYLNPLYLSTTQMIPMIPVCRVRLMQIWCSQYQKAISHMRLQQREFEILALIRQQEMELNRITSILTIEQKNQIRCLEIRSEISKLARNMNLEYPKEIQDDNNIKKKKKVKEEEEVEEEEKEKEIEEKEKEKEKKETTTAGNSISTQQEQQQQQQRLTMMKRHKSTSTSRARSNSLKHSILSMLTSSSSSSSKDLNTNMATSTHGTSTASMVSLPTCSTRTNNKEHQHWSKMKNEIHLLEIQLNKMNQQIYKKENEAMHLIHKFRCYNYNIFEENTITNETNTNQLLAVGFEYFLQQQQQQQQLLSLPLPSPPPLPSSSLSSSPQLSSRRLDTTSTIERAPVVGDLPLHPNDLQDQRYPRPNSSASNEHFPGEEGELSSHFRNSQPVWERDGDAPCCKRCKKKFKALYRNRHHCRCCGYVFCGKCTNNRMNLPEFGYYDVVRVCNVCYNTGEDM